ncbi:glycosyltransferase family 2 protein [Crenothrix sp.]|uniref:glycosyltransferase family 2 protein n=1 Tax=Crenothrix sp. TaxID=3100433 RepID=UPI00374D4A09
MNSISVIVTTYNWPAALKLCLEALYMQTDSNFEIIVADDGSTTANVAMNKSVCAQSPMPVKYVHQEDQGFRASTIRNKAVVQSAGEYLIFLDGDCVVRQNFISRHRKLAVRGCFVPGNRVLISQSFTENVINHSIALYKKNALDFFILSLQSKINRSLPFLTLPLGKLRLLAPKKWQKAMTCNLAMWRDDFLRVNGFDELFEGWGFEDSDLVIRLIHAGIKRKEGRFSVPVLHLWHSQNNRNNQDLNYQRLLKRLHQQDFIFAEKGLSQYLAH